jgi:hypothetical protein
MRLREQSEKLRQTGNEYRRQLRVFRENLEALANSQRAFVADGKSAESGEPFGWLVDAETKASESLEALDEGLRGLHNSASFWQRNMRISPPAMGEAKLTLLELTLRGRIRSDDSHGPRAVFTPFFRHCVIKSVITVKTASSPLFVEYRAIVRCIRRIRLYTRGIYRINPLRQLKLRLISG